MIWHCLWNCRWLRVCDKTFRPFHSIHSSVLSKKEALMMMMLCFPAGKVYVSWIQCSMKLVCASIATWFHFVENLSSNDDTVIALSCRNNCHLNCREEKGVLKLFTQNRQYVPHLLSANAMATRKYSCSLSRKTSHEYFSYKKLTRQLQCPFIMLFNSGTYYNWEDMVSSSGVQCYN